MKQLSHTLLLILFFLPAIGFSSAQASKTDSLLNTILISSNDTNKVKLLIDYGYLMINRSVDSAVAAYSGALNLSKHIGYQKGEAEANYCIGTCHLGFTGESDSAYYYLMNSLTISKQINNQRMIGKCYHYLAYYFLHYEEDLINGEKYFDSAIVVFRNNNEVAELVHTLSAKANFFVEQKRIEEAKGLLSEAIALQQKSPELIDKRNLLVTLGGVLLEESEIDTVVKVYTEALKLSSEKGDVRWVSYIHSVLAEAYAHDGNYPMALQEAKIGLQIAEANNLTKERLDAYTVLVKIYEAQNDFKTALEYYKYHRIFSDSLTKATAEQVSETFQNKLLTQKNQEEINLLKKDQELQKSESKQQKMAIWFSLTGLFFVLVFSIIIVKRWRLSQKQNAIIELQKIIVEEKNKEITDSIAYAKRIQNAILPTSQKIAEYLPESFILYKPKDIVAGDFYWLEMKDNKILFAAADCTGHGVPGAMVSVICNNGLNRSTREHNLTDPGQILDKTRKIIIEEFEKSNENVKDGMDISLCSLEGTILKYAGANNPLWIIRKNSDIIQEVLPDKQPIGSFDKAKPFTTHELILNKGDMVYLFTDGYADQFGGENLPDGKAGGKKFKAANFKKLLLSICKRSMNEQKTEINDTLEKWKGTLEQVDDICVFGVRI